MNLYPKIPFFIIAFFLLTTINNTSLFSQVDNEESSEKRIEFGLLADYNSRYIWRGLVLSEGSVIQPSGWASYKNFTLNVWGNLDLKPTEHVFNEFDITGTYQLEIKTITFEPSFVIYSYPFSASQPVTMELGLKISKNIFSSMTVYLSNNLDVVRYPGAFYIEPGLNYEHEFSGFFNSGITGGMGWSTSKFYNAYAGSSQSGFNEYFFNIYGNFTFQNYCCVRPRFELNMLIDKSLKEAAGKNYIINLGITLSKDF